MTCIVGLVDGETIYMGSDSAASNGWDTRITRVPKVFGRRFHNDPGTNPPSISVLIGYTSSFRMGQLLQYDLSVLPPKPMQSAQEWLVTGFVESARKLFAERGFAYIENSQQSGGEFLIAVNQRLFKVQSDFNVQTYTDAFDAIGCGAPYALGALATMSSRMKPEKRVLKALQTAARFSNGVCPPFAIEVL